MPTQEVSSRTVQLRDTPPAIDAVDDARTDEIGPRATKSARQAHYADRFAYFLPLAFCNAHTIRQDDVVSFRAQIDRGDLLPSRLHCQPPAHPLLRQPILCSLFTSIEGQPSILSRPVPLQRPDPLPPIMRLRFFRNRLETRHLNQFPSPLVRRRPCSPDPRTKNANSVNAATHSLYFPHHAAVTDHGSDFRHRSGDTSPEVSAPDYG
jgi:hypothetical protein